jgi:hypothetical protein
MKNIEQLTGGALNDVIPRNINVKPNALLYRSRPTSSQTITGLNET